MKTLTSAVLILAGNVALAGGAIGYAEATGSSNLASLAVTVGLACVVTGVVRSWRDLILARRSEDETDGK